MLKKIVFSRIVLLIGLVLASCAPVSSTEDPMMEPKATDSMMEPKATDTVMEPEATDAMMEEVVPATGSDEMMDKSATPEMMDEMVTPEMMEETHDPMMGTETPQADMMEEGDGMMAPAWFSTELTDEGTGETFRIEDFKGKVVLVETFAQWCPTCLRQQMEMMKLMEMVGMRDDLVAVSLDVDPNEDAAMLQKYLDKHGFDWRFSISPTETNREIGDLYGMQFLNPTSAPVLIIDRKGVVHPLPFGVKSAKDLQEALKTYLDTEM